MDDSEYKFHVEYDTKFRAMSDDQLREATGLAIVLLCGRLGVGGVQWVEKYTNVALHFQASYGLVCPSCDKAEKN
jgi:hypothetical protein